MLSRRALALLLAGLLVALSSCKSTVTVRLEDTEKRTFALRCDGAECTAKRVVAPPESPNKSEVMIVSPGRIVGICDAAPDDEKPPASDCRPIRCSGNEECPPAIGLKYGVCVNEHCIEPSHDVTVEDSVMLCLAGTGTGRNTPKQAELYVLGLNCGEPCQVPRVCPQP